MDEAGGNDLRVMVDFRSASWAEIEGLATEEWLYGVLLGGAQLVRSLGRGV